MTKAEKTEFAELKGLFQSFLDDRADPKNGWKTDRRVFETGMIAEMKATNTELIHIKDTVSCLPELKEQVTLNTLHRETCDSNKWNRRDKIAGIALVVSVITFYVLNYI